MLRQAYTSERSIIPLLQICLARIHSGARTRSTMSATLAPVRPIELSETREARKRIAATIVRTPLIRLELGPDYPDIRLKLENLHPINAYKLRGAANAVAMLSESERERGVWTISAGNAGQGVAYGARKGGLARTAVAMQTAPAATLPPTALCGT